MALRGLQFSARYLHCVKKYLILDDLFDQSFSVKKFWIACDYPVVSDSVCVTVNVYDDFFLTMQLGESFYPESANRLFHSTDHEH